MDLDGDGTRDLVVGCFQGYMHFLKGNADGSYAKEEWIKDRNGHEIHMGQYWGTKQNKWMYITQVEGVADDNILLHPRFVDWDNDGDLDLIGGGDSGNIGLRINEGSATKPEFSSTPMFVKAGDNYIDLKSQVCVEIVDINKDGLFDLVCATEEAITWYENTGKKGAPEFGAPRTVAGLKKDGPHYYLCVTALDFDGDGTTDLLVGAEDADYNFGYWLYPGE